VLYFVGCILLSPLLNTVLPLGAYNARDYQQLNVPMEVRDLFQYIERYKPHEVLLETPLRCFIPEFIPAIGELDAFIKVTHSLLLWHWWLAHSCVWLGCGAGRQVAVVAVCSAVGASHILECAWCCARIAVQSRSQ
jgi:hypothetical protein